MAGPAAVALTVRLFVCLAGAVVPVGRSRRDFGQVNSLGGDFPGVVACICRKTRSVLKFGNSAPMAEGALVKNYQRQDVMRYHLPDRTMFHGVLRILLFGV